MAKFEVGEIAKVISIRQPIYLSLVGEEVEIIEICKGLRIGDHLFSATPNDDAICDYVARFRDGRPGFFLERQLRKRPQPGIPLEVREWFEVPVPAKRREQA